MAVASRIGYYKLFMITWLASYPRSGNTFFRVVLHRLFEYQTHDLYPSEQAAKRFPEERVVLRRLVGPNEVVRDIAPLIADFRMHFVKTHDLPNRDNNPAVVLIRDGRDAVVSYAHFFLKTERGIDHPGRDLFEETLRGIVDGDSFGGWSDNVNAWVDRVGPDRAVRYEDLVKDPVHTVTAALSRVGLNCKTNGTGPPSFEELHALIPWFFRRGRQGSWRSEMPKRLQDRFLQKHGETLLRLGYSE